MGRSKRSKIFFGTLIKCRNNELLRKFSFLKITTKETTMHIQAYTLHNMTNKSNSTITYYYKDILYSRKQRQKNLGLHRYLADWKLDSSKNKIRVSDFFSLKCIFSNFFTENGIFTQKSINLFKGYLSWADNSYFWKSSKFDFHSCHKPGIFCKFCVSYQNSNDKECIKLGLFLLEF